MILLTGTGITASKHYAKWVPRGYVEPPMLSDGELVADLIARIAESPHSDPTSASTAKNDLVEGASNSLDLLLSSLGRPRSSGG